MTTQVPKTQLAARSEIVSEPLARSCTDRTFELPPALHIATAGLFLGAIITLCLAFASPGLAVPFGIIVAFIAAFFTVPSLWATMGPIENRSKALSWSRFMGEGIMTATGKAGGRDAAVLVLLLPGVVFAFALAIAIISLVVR